MSSSIQSLSVIVPENPFTPREFRDKQHCLCAMDVEKLMDWWPGKPHYPHRNANKVKSIQRSLDWKRVAQIAAYLLQEEILEAPAKLEKYFEGYYKPKNNELGRQWPPKLPNVIKYQRSEFPTFSNVLLHVNGAKLDVVAENKNTGDLSLDDKTKAAQLIFDESLPSLNFSVIDGQHRINGAYLAICIKREQNKDAKWQIPAQIFLELDPSEGPPRKQAAIFIDVNFYQKKVDKSLVADLFPTARGLRDSLDFKERAQDIGRKLMLETGPLIGMIQIPGIRYGVKDVITLATLNSAIEDCVPDMERHEDLNSLESQTDFFAQCLTAWLEASGRFESKDSDESVELSPENVAYQGRILVSVLTLIPGLIWKLIDKEIELVSDQALFELTEWLKEIAKRARLLKRNKFIDKKEFKELGYLGSGGIGRFRDVLWAAMLSSKPIPTSISKISELAEANRANIRYRLNTISDEQ